MIQRTYPPKMIRIRRTGGPMAFAVEAFGASAEIKRPRAREHSVSRNTRHTKMRKLAGPGFRPLDQ
jgi:hypothetical protein